MTKPYVKLAATLTVFGVSAAAQAQWITFTNQTATRMPTGAGLNDPATSTADPTEKHYAWADFDKDGDIDLVCFRKTPLSFPGGRSAVLFMNENGVLMDRTSTLAVDANGIPAGFTSQGFLDLCNTREVRSADVNNDGWIDLVTCNTIADGEQKYIGHPRVYINKGEIGGVWQGFRFENDRIPQMLSKTGAVANPRFCDVSVGDVNGDGYVDLYFSDYDSGEVGPPENSNNDFDNKLLINQGASNPGFFTDESILRMGAMFNYPGIGNKNLLLCSFGAAGLIYDLNGDGLKDVVKDTTLGSPLHVALLTNPIATPGVWNTASYKIFYNGAPYFVSSADLNNDGKMDLVITDDSADKYLLNTGNDAQGAANFTSFNFSYGSGLSDPGFSTKSTIVDLNNDGFNEVIIADMDLDTFSCSRQSHLYHNLGNVPNVTLKEETPIVIPAASMKGVYQVCAFDINGDGWKDLVIGRCTNEAATAGATEVWMQTAPSQLLYSYPNGKPSVLTPDTATTFQVNIAPSGAGSIVAGTAKIFISVNGAAFASTDLVSLGGSLYEATIPAQSCGTHVRYYLSARHTTSGFWTDPFKGGPSANFSAPVVNSFASVVNDDFEAGAGSWTVSNDGGLTAGGWTADVPVGTWNEGQKVAPDVNHTSGGTKAFITGAGIAGGAVGDADVDGGETALISQTIDLAGSNAVVSYARWFYTSTPGDSLRTYVSNDNGANWVLARTYTGPAQPEANFFNGIKLNTWNLDSFVVGDYVTPTAQVKIKFVVGDAAPAGFVEGGIDDVAINQFQCALPCPADINGTGDIDIDDLFLVINNWGATSGPADINDSGEVDVDDLFAVINGWGDCP